MADQLDFFGFDELKFDNDSKYTRKIKTPVYQPREGQGDLYSCYDETKYKQLVQRINNSNVSEEQKHFLRLAATRFIEFNYENIADYYAIADKDMQDLIERLALVIIDFDKAIEYGIVQLDDRMKKLYQLELNGR